MTAKLIRPKNVCEDFLNCSEKQLDELRKREDFPKPVKLYEHARAIYFLSDEIEAFVEKLRQERNSAN